MAITQKEMDVLKSAPLRGQYVLSLGCRPGRWTWLAGEVPVTRQANSLFAKGMLSADLPPQSPAGQHPASFSAKADLTDAGRAALAVIQ